MGKKKLWIGIFVIFAAVFFYQTMQHTDEKVELKSLHSPYSVLLNRNTGKIVAGHKEEHKIYPASLTKIMTVIVALENIKDEKKTMTMPADFFARLYEENASMAGFLPGEEVRIKDLFYGAMLPSGAECCLALANRVSGSEEQYVKLMNQKAKELKMKNTHFCNTTGLHQKDHFSTVKDLAFLLQYALKNEEFREIFTTSRYSTLPSEEHPEGFTFSSTMFDRMENRSVQNGEILGGKTGYTQKAGLCLASLAQISNTEYILITAGAKGSHQTEPYHLIDACRVYNQLASAQ